MQHATHFIGVEGLFHAPVIGAAPLAALFLLFQRLVVLLDKFADLVRHGQQFLPLLPIQGHGKAPHSIDRKRSLFAFISSSVGMIFNSFDTTWYAQISPTMCALQAIFFDFDGVLLDTEPAHSACWAEVLAPAGVTLTWEYYRDHCIGIDDRDMLRAMARQSWPPVDGDSL